MSENIYEILRKSAKETPAPSFEDHLNHYYDEKVMVAWNSGKSKLLSGEEILDLLEEKSADLSAFQVESLDREELNLVADELGQNVEGEWQCFSKQRIKNLPKNLFDLVFFKKVTD